LYLQDTLILPSEQTTPDSPSQAVFVSAIESCVYNIPAMSCAILYVSKVDSTGQATASAPSPTPVLVHALLLFYADLAARPIMISAVADHLWIHRINMYSPTPTLKNTRT
jgi:regulator of Ty1 transposition protein 109